MSGRGCSRRALPSGEGRRRAGSFVAGGGHAGSHPIGRHVRLPRSGGRVMVASIGHDAAEGEGRGRPILSDPAERPRAFGIGPAAVEPVIVAHPRDDHAGPLRRFPAATRHLQAVEMACATGPCMRHAPLGTPFAGEHAHEAARGPHRGRVVLREGDGEIASGAALRRIGGRSRGLQAARAGARAGWAAQDAAHRCGGGPPGGILPVGADVEDMRRGLATTRAPAPSRGMTVPGHDPLARRLSRRAGGAGGTRRPGAGLAAALAAAGRLA